MATPSVFVPASQVVATAKSVLEGADNMDRAFFKEWVYLGLQELGPNMAWFGEATIYPVDYALRKSADLHSTIDIALYDSENKELRFVYRGKGTRIHESDTELINDGTYAPMLGSSIDLSEDAYYYNVGTSEGAQSIAYAKIKYFRLQLDEEGDLMVPESDIFPLTLFIRYMWYMRKEDKRGMAMAHPIWIAARNDARTAHKTFGPVPRSDSLSGAMLSPSAPPSLHPQLGGLSFVDAHLILQFRCRSPMSGRVWRWHANLTALIPYRL